MDKKRGFTLVEMSIVLLIIALLLGAIVVGKNIIMNARLMTIATDLERFKKAINQFQEKYNFLPGDLPTATTYWGADTGCPNGNTAAPYAPRTVTCNGDGNGKIRDLFLKTYTTPVTLGDSNFESLRAWQHLANAGFIEGMYSGVAYNLKYKPGINIPASKFIGDAGFIFFYSDIVDSSNSDPAGTAISGAPPGEYGHVIEYGAVNLASPGVVATFNGEKVLSPIQALTLDTKIDDGKPSTGNIRAFTTRYNPDCTTALNGDYNLSYADRACSIIFITGM